MGASKQHDSKCHFLYSYWYQNQFMLVILNIFKKKILLCGVYFIILLHDFVFVEIKIIPVKYIPSSVEMLSGQTILCAKLH